MKIIENTLFLLKSRGFLPLITAWLEVRVLLSAFRNYRQPIDRSRGAGPYFEQRFELVMTRRT
jgi:hypothetical protein